MLMTLAPLSAASRIMECYNFGMLTNDTTKRKRTNRAEPFNGILWTMMRTISEYSFVLFLLLAAVDAESSQGPEMIEYCQWELFNASCGQDEVILMHSARYGRMRFGRCMKEDHGSAGCAAVVLPQLDLKCSARRTCQLLIPDPSMHNMHPCPKELMPYLEASYTCVTVRDGSTQDCAAQGGLSIPAEPAIGFLGSLTAIETSVGSRHCPWSIEVEPEQKINITLFSFSGASPELKTGGPNNCDWTLVLQEGNKTTQLSGCAGPAREKLIYTTSGAAGGLRIYAQTTPSVDLTKTSHILLKYHVFGCVSIGAPANSIVTRHENTMVVQCISTRQTYVLTCVDSKWKGDFTNCTNAAAMGSGPTSERTANEFPYGTGLLIVIGIGVVMGIAVGIIMLFAIVLCLRKRREKILRSHTTDPLLQKSPEYSCGALGADDLTNSIYSQRRRINGSSGDFAAASSTSTLCPYHHHLKFHHASSPTSDCIPSDSGEGGGGGFRGVGERFGGFRGCHEGSSVISNMSSYPLLVVNASLPPPAVPRSASMYDRRRSKKLMTSSMTSSPSCRGPVIRWTKDAQGVRDSCDGQMTTFRREGDTPRSGVASPAARAPTTTDKEEEVQDGSNEVSSGTRFIVEDYVSTIPRPSRSVDELQTYNCCSPTEHVTALDIIRHSQTRASPVTTCRTLGHGVCSHHVTGSEQT